MRLLNTDEISETNNSSGKATSVMVCAAMNAVDVLVHLMKNFGKFNHDLLPV